MLQDAHPQPHRPRPELDLVLFEKEYSKEKIAQPRLLGSLLAAMTRISDAHERPASAARPTSRPSSLAVTMCAAKTA